MIVYNKNIISCRKEKISWSSLHRRKRSQKMIDFFNANTFIGKKVKLKFTKESLEKSEKNKEIIEENNEWLDKVLKKINFFKRHGLSSQKDVDFSTGVVTSVGKDVDYEENDDGKEFYYIELDSYKWINLNEIEEIIEIE